MEFLTTYPVAYLHRSFNLGRQFEFKWTVNWRFLGEELFLDRRLHVLFLAVHMLLLILFFKRHWITKPSSFYSAGTNYYVFILIIILFKYIIPWWRPERDQPVHLKLSHSCLFRILLVLYAQEVYITSFMCGIIISCLY